MIEFIIQLLITILANLGVCVSPPVPVVEVPVVEAPAVEAPTVTEAPPVIVFDPTVSEAPTVTEAPAVGEAPTVDAPASPGPTIEYQVEDEAPVVPEIVDIDPTDAVCDRNLDAVNQQITGETQGQVDAARRFGAPMSRDEVVAFIESRDGSECVDVDAVAAAVGFPVEDSTVN